MGVFDYVRCKLTIPGVTPEMEFQTKDTPAQYLEQYEVRADGSLWHQDYDTEDRSDPNAEGMARLVGMATAINKRWVRCNSTGCVDIYHFRPPVELEFALFYINGELRAVVDRMTGQEVQWKAGERIDEGDVGP